MLRLLALALLAESYIPFRAPNRQRSRAILEAINGRKVWVVLSHCFEDVKVEAIYPDKARAEADYPTTDEHGFATGYEIVEQTIVF